MAFYLIEATYSSEGWAALLANPHNRAEAIRPGVEGLGGRIHGLWYSFGDYDLVGIFELPANSDIAAFMMAAAANPAVKAIKTTTLLTMEEGIEAMRKAPSAGYRAPTDK
jgi:uncharacterized protein with GYD domain